MFKRTLFRRVLELFIAISFTVLASMTIGMQMIGFTWGFGAAAIGVFALWYFHPSIHLTAGSLFGWMFYLILVLASPLLASVIGISIQFGFGFYLHWALRRPPVLE